jgi:hypothetical protein
MRSKMPHDERESLSDEHAEDSYTAGGLVNGSPDSSDDARGPRVRRRKPPITDGPFTETKELLGGWASPDSARR